MPSDVGTGATPQFTASPYTAIAHGPTVAIAALPSAKESPLNASLGDRPAANIGEKSNQDWKNSLVGAGQIAASAAPLSTIVRLVARNSSCVDNGGFSGSMPAFFRRSLL